MDIFDVQTLFTQLNPNKNITYTFDEKTTRTIELIFTEGLPNPFHHMENSKVKVTVEGAAPVYVMIDPHREVCTWEYARNLIANKSLETWVQPELPIAT